MYLLQEHSAGLSAAYHHCSLVLGLGFSHIRELYEGRLEYESEGADADYYQGGMQHGETQVYLVVQYEYECTGYCYAGQHTVDAGQIVLRVEIPPQLVVGSEDKQTSEAGYDRNDKRDQKRMIRDPVIQCCQYKI